MESAIQSISRRSGTGRFTTSQIQPDPTVLGNLRRLELKIIPKTEHWCGAGATQNGTDSAPIVKELNKCFIILFSSMKICFYEVLHIIMVKNLKI